jgi:hypothetical protein
VRRCALAGRLLICTDGLCSYVRATREAFRDKVATGRRGRQPLRVWGRLLIAQVVKLNYQGWDKISISRFLHVSRPTVDRWIARIASECSAVSGDMAEKEATKRPLNTRQVMRQPVKS